MDAPHVATALVDLAGLVWGVLVGSLRPSWSVGMAPTRLHSSPMTPATRTKPLPVARLRRLRAYGADLWSRREFAWFMAMGNLKAKNASTAFGLLWWVINPLLLGLVYYLVFGVIFPGERDLGYLMTGMFVFHFTSQSMTGGANAILQNSKLLVNLRFPRLVLPLANLAESGVGFLASLIVLYVLAVPAGSVVSLRQLPWFLVIAPIHVLFNLGLSALTARLAVPFRDINNITPYVTRLWLYLSPIIWPLSFLDKLSDSQRLAVEFNPMYWMINAYRAALLGSEFELAAFGWSALFAALIGVSGIALFVKYENRIVRYL